MGRKILVLGQTGGAKLVDVSGDSLDESSSRSDHDEDSDERRQHARQIGEDEIDVGDGRTVSKDLVLRVTQAGTYSYLYYGEVSFLLPGPKQTGTIDLVDQFHPLNFIRCMGIPRKDAFHELVDPKLYTRVQVVLREARVWARRLTHGQAILLYAAAEAMVSGRYMMEYMGMVTDAVINNKIRNFPDLDGFLRLIRQIYFGNLSWRNLLPIVQQKTLQSPTVLQHVFTTAKAFHETFQLAQLLRTEDDDLLELLEQERVEQETLATASTSVASDHPDEKGDRNKEKAVLDGLRNRNPTTITEMQHYCCVFANLFDPGLIKFIPMVAHMIARGMFTHYRQVEAVVDYLGAVIGQPNVKLSQMREVIASTNEWLADSEGQEYRPTTDTSEALVSSVTSHLAKSTSSLSYRKRMSLAATSDMP